MKTDLNTTTTSTRIPYTHGLTSSKKTFRRFISSMIWNARYGFSLRKPRRVLRILKNMMNVQLNRDQPCRTLDISVTNDCNLRCQHCFAESFKEGQIQTKARLLTIDEYETLGRQVDKLGFFGITFTGGEPLLRKDLFQIIQKFDPGTKFISIATNGTLWTPSLLEKAKSAGVDCLYVSVDDLDPTIHDEFRGQKDTLSKALDTIKTARQKGLQVAVNTTVTREGLYSTGFNKMIEWTRSRAVLLLLNLACPSGNWRHREDLYFQETDTAYMTELLLRHPHVRIDYEANYKKWGCPAFKERFYITATGEVIPCPFIHISFGNILHESLAAIRQRGMSTTHFNDYKPLCLAAQDRDFITKYLFPIQDQHVLPADYRSVFDDPKDWINGVCPHAKMSPSSKTVEDTCEKCLVNA